MSAAQKATIDEMDARQRLQALRLLDDRKQRIANELDATSDRWRKTLTEETTVLHNLIKEPAPAQKECRGRVDAIKAAFEKREKSKEKKKGELSKIKARVASVEAAMLELIRSEPTDQMALDLDADGAPVGGISMSNETAKAVGAALEDHVQQGGALTPDMHDLQKRLDDMGVAGLRIVPSEAPPEDEDPANASADESLTDEEAFD